MKKILFTILGLSLNIVHAHSGRTNGAGCHNDRIHGGYHCHNTGSSGSSSSYGSSNRVENTDLDIGQNNTSKPLSSLKKIPCDGITLIASDAECNTKLCKKVKISAMLTNASDLKKAVYFEIFTNNFGWIYRKTPIIVGSHKAIDTTIMRMPQNLYGGQVRVHSCSLTH